MTCTKPFLGPSQLGLLEVITVEEQLHGLPEDMRALGPDSTLASASTMIQPRPSPPLPPAQASGSGSHFVIHVLTTLSFCSLKEHIHALFPECHHTNLLASANLLFGASGIRSHIGVEARHIFSSLQATW